MWLYLKGLVADSKDCQGAIIGNCEQPLQIRLYTIFCIYKGWWTLIYFD